MIQITEVRGVFARHPFIQLDVDGAELAVLHRAYTAAFGPHDGITRDTRAALCGGTVHVEYIDRDECGRTAEIFAALGMKTIAQRFYDFAIEDEIDALENKIDGLRREIHRRRYSEPLPDFAVADGLRCG